MYDKISCRPDELPAPPMVGTSIEQSVGLILEYQLNQANQPSRAGTAN
jgi:hypothetical protein